ncbi:type II secretion system protein GspL [Idiomarina tyrosinivorans]|uniref:Type II secretion system protein L n=1 Tax=Idiomarina tyrosinivorans TaxID=1445662 RepID=A0A432ZQV7_9GAMM|nr:type II secretion system protein GspL [Idiomarina tyrosinivorans]RUO80294.1 type II secretion system protein GspL [Idiomarina tyrosinivorans]
MQERLIIRLPATTTEQAPIHWLVWDSREQHLTASGVLAGPAELAQLSNRAARCEVSIYLAGQAIRLIQLTLPAGARKHLERVVPFALEEDVSSDIEQLHFAWPPSSKDEALPVAIVDRDCLQFWRQALRDADIDSDAIYPDIFMLPWQPGQWQLATFGDDIVVRTGQWQGFSVERELFSVLQDSLTSEYEMPQAIVVHGDIDWPQPPAPIEHSEQEIPLAAAAGASGGINLLQGQFRGRRKRQSKQLPWRPLAVAAAVLVAVVFGGEIIRYAQLSRQVSALREQTEQAYRQAFPNDTRIVNLRTQLQRHLDEVAPGAERDSIIRLLAQLEPVFSALPELKVSLMRYQDKQLRMQILADNFQQFEQFQQQAEALQLSVQQGQLTNQGEKVSGTLTVSSGGRS